MAEPLFLTIDRQPAGYRPVAERVQDFRDVALPRTEPASQTQASRCLSCGVPYCHWACPIGNYVPDWNTLIARGEWERAYRRLAATNNLPEVTARICPALCEAACVLNLGYEPVTIREDELAVIERAFAAGYVQPRRPSRRTGKAVAVVGSGPAGLACADQLNQAGHRVTVFEAHDRVGGILRYGIPDFKLEKWVLDRRLAIWQEEGIEYVTGVRIGADRPASQLREEFDAVCLAGGSRVPRDLAVPGRDLRGIHFAMEYLVQANRRVAGEAVPSAELIDARGKRVVVIGGGDTGADCVGTAHRQGAREVVQIELLPRPPALEDRSAYWPNYPLILRASSSHEEGGTRQWSVTTRRFLGEAGRVTGLVCAQAKTTRDPEGRFAIEEMAGTEYELAAELVLLALGFQAADSQLLAAFGVPQDARGLAAADALHRTAVPGVFVAGDMRRGQSLVVWAIREGREAAHAIDCFLMGRSALPTG